MSLSNIMGIFAKSPIKPLEEHINKVHSCCEALKPFFQAVIAEDWDTAQEIQRDISLKEKEADEMKRALRLQMPAKLFMPVERTDMLSLLSEQDKMANIAKDVAGRTIWRKFVLPENIHADFLSYVERCIDAVDQARKAINELDELLETGFAGREITLVQEMIEELDRIEDDTDNMQIRLHQGLRSLEPEMNPVDVIMLYKVIEWIGELANRADGAGSRLEQMLTRN